MIQRRSLNILWAAPVIAVAFTILSAVPCLACSCGLDTAADRVRAASVIFVGTVTSIEETDSVFTTLSGAKEQRIRFAVDRVLKGETTVTTAVRAYPDDGFCGYRFAVGGRYTVFDHGGTTTLCAGTTDRAIDLEGFGLGAARPPLPDPPFAIAPALPIVAPIVALAVGGIAWLGRRRRAFTPEGIGDRLGMSRRDLVGSALVGAAVVAVAHVILGPVGDRAVSAAATLACVIAAMARLRPRALVVLAIATVVSLGVLTLLRGRGFVGVYPGALLAFMLVLLLGAPLLLIAAAIKAVAFRAVRAADRSTRVWASIAVGAATALSLSLIVSALTWDWPRNF